MLKSCYWLLFWNFSASGMWVFFSHQVDSWDGELFRNDSCTFIISTVNEILHSCTRTGLSIFSFFCLWWVETVLFLYLANFGTVDLIQMTLFPQFIWSTYRSYHFISCLKFFQIFSNSKFCNFWVVASIWTHPIYLISIVYFSGQL